LWFLTKKKSQPGKTLFIDARNMGYMKDRTHRELDPDTDIKKIADTFEAFRRGESVDEKGFAAATTTADIAKEGYVLTPGRYVGVADIEDDGEPFDEKVARLTGELRELFAQSSEQENEIRKQLASIGITL
jgi:type I restriction enzyme M protein